MTDASPQPATGQISRFLDWWGGELSSMLPGWLGGALGLFQETVLLVPEADGFIARSGFTGRGKVIGQLNLPSVAARVAALRAAGVECVLQLAADQGLLRQAPIAHAALSRGFEAFWGEIERQTPFAPDQVYLGYTAGTALDPRGRVMTRFAVAPCAGVDAVLQRLSEFGISPDRITLADPDAAESPGVTVRRLALLSRRAPKMLLAAAALLFVIALASPFVHNRAMLAEIQAELETVRASAITGAGNRQNRNDAQAQLAYLATHRNARPPVVAVLDALTRALPDTSHAGQFNLSGTELTVQGVARSAPGLIAPLEALPIVSEVGFAAPVLRDPAADNEQFHLLIKLRPASGAAP